MSNTTPLNTDLGDFIARVRARMDLVRQAAAVTASRASARRNAEKIARIEQVLRLDPRCTNRQLAERADVSLGIATRHRQRLQKVARR